MATPHIGAEPGAFATDVLMPGDPRRARRIAETVLEDAELVTEVRGMLGYTGTFEGRPVSVLASGMGLPSISDLRDGALPVLRGQADHPHRHRRWHGTSAQRR